VLNAAGMGTGKVEIWKDKKEIDKRKQGKIDNTLTRHCKGANESIGRRKDKDGSPIRRR